VATPSVTENWKCLHWLVSGADARNGLISRSQVLRRIDCRHKR
jgi:hypothetical protein